MNSMMDWRTAPLMPQGVEHRLTIIVGVPAYLRCRKALNTMNHSAS